MNRILGCKDSYRVDFVQVDPVFWAQNAKQVPEISDNDNVYKMSPSKNEVITENEPKSRFSHIEEGLESSLSKEAQNTINRLVNEVKSLSDVEKLFLYLKLPSGDSCKDLRKTPTSVGIQKPNRTQQAQTYTWIKSHLEEDELICLPKQDVYDDYKLYCETHDIKALSTADFGKLMKSVFPNVKPRRLGQRGQSRYCYGGLRKKLDVHPPTLPELEIIPSTPAGNEDDEIHTASCQLVCEWAHKLLNANFQGIKDLAEYLISNLCVNSKSVAAFTVIAAMEDAGIQNIKEPSLFSNTTGGDRHRETQMLLQRKLQEGKLLREQKKKLQQQREENELKLKESQDRQTPFITSPSIHALKSPAKRLFEDNNNGGRSKSVQGKVLPSQSLFVEQKNNDKNQRSKSISDADVEMVCVEKDPSLPPKTTMHNSIAEPKPDQQTVDTRYVFIEKPQTTMSPGIPNETRCVQVTNSIARNGEKLSNLKSKISNLGSCDSESLNIVLHEARRTTDEVDGNRPASTSVVSVEMNCDNLSSPSHHVIRKPSVISANDWHNSPSNKNIQSVDSAQNDSTDMENMTLITASSHSSRSAFVPFSQIQGRKEEPCKTPPISLTQSDGQIYVTVPNNFDITKLPSHFLEKIEQVVGPSQLVKVEEPRSNEIPNKNTEQASKIAFQPVLQSGIIAPSSMATSMANDKVSSQNLIITSSVGNISQNSSIVSPQIVTVNGKIILPANINIGGSTGIIVGQTNLPVGQTNLPVGQTNLPVGQTNLPVGQTNLPEKTAVTLSGQLMTPLLAQAPPQTVFVQSSTPSHESKVRKPAPGVVLQARPSDIQNILLQSTPQLFPSVTSAGQKSAVHKTQEHVGNAVSNGLLPNSSLPMTVAASGKVSNFTPNVLSQQSAITTSVSVSMTTVVSSSSSSPTKVAMSPCWSSSDVHPLPSVVCSEGNQECTDVPTNPSTPKKSSKSRFVSIRPKASPVKTSSTISSILKDPKIMPTEPFVYDKSKSVSELLKEKRAREAELKNKQKNVEGTTQSANPPLCSENIPSSGSFLIPTERGDGSIKNLFAVGLPKQTPSNTFIANTEMIEQFQRGQVIPPGLIPIGKSGDIVYVINPLPQLVEKTADKLPATRPNTLNLDQDGGKAEQISRSKTVNSPDLNDDDTMDIEDLVRMHGGKLDEVSCETPSKFAKIEDGDQNVHSRPGSRCSEVEPPGGRKRKFLNSEVAAFKCFGRKRLNSADENEEDIIELDLFEDNNDRKESKSCTMEIDKGSSNIMSKAVSMRPPRSQHYPDISMLEIDALVDLDKPEHPRNNHPHKIVQSASVGVNSLSWRRSQQQLLKEKSRLDKSVRTFLQKIDKTESSQPDWESSVGNGMAVSGISTNERGLLNQASDHQILPVQNHIGDQATLSGSYQNPNHFDNLSTAQGIQSLLQSSSGFNISTQNARMEEDSDLPKDVADFITDVVTGRISAEIENSVNYPGFDTNHSLIDNGNKQNLDYSENLNRNIPLSVHSPMEAYPSTVAIIDDRRNSQPQKSESTPRFEKPSHVDEVKFASPQRPVSRRQRTPSVERTLNNVIDRRSVPTPTLFPSPVHSSTLKRREPSVDRVANQTPISDPGYGSVGASPILNPTPVGNVLTCDTSVTSGYNSSFLSTRADSAQSIASDANMFSPVSATISPRFQTSTPYPLQSPCPTPNIMQSPDDAIGPGLSFVPIQGSQLQISSNVTLIKPVVTLASSQPNNATQSLQAREHNKLRKDLIGIGSILPRTDRHVSQRPPPSYSDALLSQLHGDKRMINNGAFNTPHQTDENSDQVLSAPFSYKLAMMSNRYGIHKSPADLHNRSLPEHLLQSNDARKELSIDEQEKSFQIESIKASLQNTSLHAPNYASDVREHEIVLSPRLHRKPSHGIIDDHIMDKVVEDDVEFMAAKRNLSVDLENNTSFNEDDLETTLEDLKSLEGQYFPQETCNILDFHRQ